MKVSLWIWGRRVNTSLPESGVLEDSTQKKSGAVDACAGDVAEASLARSVPRKYSQSRIVADFGFLGRAENFDHHKLGQDRDWMSRPFSGLSRSRSS